MLTQGAELLEVAHVHQTDPALCRRRIHLDRMPDDDVDVDALPELGGESTVVVRDPRPVGRPRCHERDPRRRRPHAAP